MGVIVCKGLLENRMLSTLITHNQVVALSRNDLAAEANGVPSGRRFKTALGLHVKKEKKNNVALANFTQTSSQTRENAAPLKKKPTRTKDRDAENRSRLLCEHMDSVILHVLFSTTMIIYCFHGSYTQHTNNYPH